MRGGEVVGLEEADQGHVALVGGKAASLGELTRVDGIRVPPGLCVTTSAFRRVMSSAKGAGELLDQLTELDPGDHDGIRSAHRRASPGHRSCGAT